MQPTDNNLAQQIDAINSALDNLVTGEDIRGFKAAKELFPKINAKIKEAERAGFNMDSAKTQLATIEKRVRQFLDVYG